MVLSNGLQFERRSLSVDQVYDLQDNNSTRTTCFANAIERLLSANLYHLVARESHKSSLCPFNKHTELASCVFNPLEQFYNCYWCHLSGQGLRCCCRLWRLMMSKHWRASENWVWCWRKVSAQRRQLNKRPSWRMKGKTKRTTTTTSVQTPTAAAAVETIDRCKQHWSLGQQLRLHLTHTYTFKRAHLLFCWRQKCKQSYLFRSIFCCPADLVMCRQRVQHHH